MTSSIKRRPFVKKIISSNRFKHIRHWFVRNFAKRDRFTLTLFYRSPTQYDALSGPVLDYIFESQGSNLKIACVGCSNGSEAYTISSVLTQKYPDVCFNVYASDIDIELIEKAKKGIYAKEDVMINPFITDEFVNNTFDIRDGKYIVKSEIKEKVNFSYQDVLAPGLNKLGTFDLVYAQNLLVNMKPKMQIKAFKNICNLLKNKSVIFLDGMDLGIRSKMTIEANLKPLDYKLEKIYEEVKDPLGAWPYWYSGLEPLSLDRKDKARRYSTIYFKGINVK